MSESFAVLWTEAGQASPSMGLPREEYWSGLPIPSPGESFPPRDRTRFSCVGRRILHHWAISEAPSHITGSSICSWSEPVHLATLLSSQVNTNTVEEVLFTWNVQDWLILLEWYFWGWGILSPKSSVVDNKILWNKMQLNICYPLKHQPLRTLTNAWSRRDCQDLRKCLPTASLTGCSKVQQTSPSLCACGAQTTTGFLLIICLMCVQKFNILFLKNSSFALSLICSSSCTLHLTDHFY